MGEPYAIVSLKESITLLSHGRRIDLQQDMRTYAALGDFVGGGDVGRKMNVVALHGFEALEPYGLPRFMGRAMIK